MKLGRRGTIMSDLFSQTDVLVGSANPSLLDTKVPLYRVTGQIYCLPLRWTQLSIAGLSLIQNPPMKWLAHTVLRHSLHIRKQSWQTRHPYALHCLRHSLQRSSLQEEHLSLLLTVQIRQGILCSLFTRIADRVVSCSQYVSVTS